MTTNSVSLIDIGDFGLAPTCKELGSCHSHPYKKTLNKLKINNVFVPVKELMSQDEPSP